MATTNPTPEVESSDAEVHQRLVSFYTKREGAPEKPAAEPVQAPPAEAADAALEAEPEDQVEATDLEAAPELDAAEAEAAEPSAAEVEFEIVHNGQEHKLTRAQTIELAQKGFDYTHKTQALAAKESEISSALASAQQVVQLQAALAPEIAQLEGFRSALKDYSGVDWIQLAQQDSGLYSQHRARFDQLRDGLQAAERAMGEKYSHIQGQLQQAEMTLFQAGQEGLVELMPQWRDQKQRDAAFRSIEKAAVKDGYTPDELIQANKMPRYVRTLWKAAEYDRIMAAQGVNLKKVREAPPMARPGAANPAPPAAVQRQQALRKKLKETGDWRIAAELYSAREQKRR